MLIESNIITRASGSVGGCTFVPSRGGLTIRAKAAPTDRHTDQQNVHRSLVAKFQSRWLILTQPQRDAWNLYALNVPMPGPLGRMHNPGGIGMYLRANVPRANLGPIAPPINDAPTVFALTELTPDDRTEFFIVLNVLTIHFNEDDTWANTSGAFLFLFTSKAQNPGTANNRRGFRFANIISGSSTLPPTSPRNLSTAQDTQSGQRMFWRLVANLPDGRVSTSLFGSDIKP